MIPSPRAGNPAWIPAAPCSAPGRAGSCFSTGTGIANQSEGSGGNEPKLIKQSVSGAGGAVDCQPLPDGLPRIHIRAPQIPWERAGALLLLVSSEVGAMS